MYSYAIYYQIKDFFSKEVFRVYSSIGVDRAYGSVHTCQGQYHRVIGRTYHSDYKYLNYLFSWHVFYSWFSGFWNTNIQEVYQI